MSERDLGGVTEKKLRGRGDTEVKVTCPYYELPNQPLIAGILLYKYLDKVAEGAAKLSGGNKGFGAEYSAEIT